MQEVWSVSLNYGLYTLGHKHRSFEGVYAFQWKSLCIRSDRFICNPDPTVSIVLVLVLVLPIMAADLGYICSSLLSLPVISGHMSSSSDTAYIADRGILRRRPPPAQVNLVACCFSMRVPRVRLRYLAPRFHNESLFSAVYRRSESSSSSARLQLAPPPFVAEYELCPARARPIEY